MRDGTQMPARIAQATISAARPVYAGLHEAASAASLCYTAGRVDTEGRAPLLNPQEPTSTGAGLDKKYQASIHI